MSEPQKGGRYSSDREVILKAVKENDTKIQELRQTVTALENKLSELLLSEEAAGLVDLLGLARKYYLTLIFLICYVYYEINPN